MARNMSPSLNPADIAISRRALFGFNPNEFDPEALSFRHSLGTLPQDDDPYSMFRWDQMSTVGVCAASNELKRHLQAAVSLELKTIPLYLYAAYSIKQPGPEKGAILRVVKQEMLHLALAGNILSAIGGSPILYHASANNHDYVPKYPTTMVYQDITLHLKSATKNNIATFMELERPDPAVVDYVEVSSTKAIYASVGSFYRAIANELSRQDLRAKANGESIFQARDNTQFDFGDGSWYDDQMVVVSDLSSAKRAIETIVDQGEGSGLAPRPQPAQVNTGRVTDPVAPIGVKTHYEVFEELRQGPTLDHYHFAEDPVIEKVTDDNLRKVLVACDAVYCYLLITIEKMWDPEFDRKTRPALVTNNLQRIMLHVLTPLATFLSTQTLEIDGKEFTAAPFFNFYNFVAGTSRRQQLINSMEEAVIAFENNKDLKKIQEVVKGLIEV